MERLETLRVFARVAEMSSFTQAAQSLGLPKATVSTAIQELETALGTRLLHRTTRKVKLTQDGLVYYERSKELLTAFDDLNSLFRGGNELQGRLRVDMPSGFAAQHILPRLPEFLDKHPRLELEFSATDRRVDLIREGFDCVLRIGPLSDSSLILRPLGVLNVVNCVSVEYANRYGVPTHPSDLARHRLVRYTTQLGSKIDGFEYVDAEGVHEVMMPVALTVNSTSAYQSACLAGLGIVQSPEIGSRALLESGHLIEIMPSYRAAPMPVTWLYAHRRQVPLRVQAFMGWVAEVLAPHLSPR